MLAVVLNNTEAARVLLRHSANTSFVSKSYWSSRCGCYYLPVIAASGTFRYGRFRPPKPWGCVGGIGNSVCRFTRNSVKPHILFPSLSLYLPSTVVQEAIATGNPTLVKLALVHRDAQVVRHQAAIMTDLLQKLRETPDFYIEMKWEFTSWRE